MKVILLCDVKGQGKKDQIVEAQADQVLDQPRRYWPQLGQAPLRGRGRGGGAV